MVIQNTNKMFRFGSIAALLMLFFIAIILPASATKATGQNTTFQVNINETLTVSLTTPETWASGGLTYDSSLGRWVSDLLVNAVTLSVASNNANGFTASMTSDSTTSAALTNTADAITSDTIPTLSASWTRSNTTNTLFWGYSLNDNNETGTYQGVPLRGATPATIMSSNVQSGGSQTIYFGAKADSTVSSGTYAGTVVISVVSGVVTTPQDNPNDNPVIPVNPATPSDTNSNNPTYNPTYDRTVYTTTTTDSVNDTTTNTTVISHGDTRNIYANPQGVTRVNEGTPLVTGLAVTAGVAATTGMFFFIVAKRRKDDEDEEDQ